MERREFLKDTTKYAAFALVATNPWLNNSLASFSDSRDHPQSLRSVPSINTFQNVTTTVQMKGKEVKVHALCTGTVAVKTAFRTKKGRGVFSKLNIIADSHFTEFMPIWVWVIEHPEGVVIVDTGEKAAAKDFNSYLAKESAFSRYFSRHAYKLNIEERDSLNYKLEQINIAIKDVSKVVLTHLHLDHTDGIKFFPNTEIIVNEFEYKHPVSNLPTTYPSWFKPNLVNYKSNRVDVFNKAYPLTAAEDILYIPTPGHSHGHSSVLMKADDFDIIFAGDTSYSQRQVLEGELAGISIDFAKSRETYKNLLAYSNNHKTIYLPAHDQDSAKRLCKRAFLV